MVVINQQYPIVTNELFAYMFTIIRAAQEFEDPALRRYDKAFHEKQRQQLTASGQKLTHSSITEFSWDMPTIFSW